MKSNITSTHRRSNGEPHLYMMEGDPINTSHYTSNVHVQSLIDASHYRWNAFLFANCFPLLTGSELTLGGQSIIVPMKPLNQASSYPYEPFLYYRCLFIRVNLREHSYTKCGCGEQSYLTLFVINLKTCSLKIDHRPSALTAL